MKSSVTIGDVSAQEISRCLSEKHKKIKDKSCGVMVDVCCKDCLKYKCYWPRPNPGSFTLGQGYMRWKIVRNPFITVYMGTNYKKKNVQIWSIPRNE